MRTSYNTPPVKLGEANGKAKLTVADIHTIRQMYASGRFTHRQIATNYDVTPAAIGHILTGRTWKHVETL